MKKTLLLISAAASLNMLMPMTAHAQFGGLLGGSKSESKEKAVDVDVFLKTAADAELLIRKSSSTLYEAVMTKEDIEKQENIMKAANSVADPKEKEAALKKADIDMQTQLAKVDFQREGEKLNKNKDAKKKTQISNAVYNFILGMLKDKELVEQGKGLVSSMSGNPMAMTKIGSVKNVVSSISDQMSNISTIASGLQKLSSVMKITELPTKTSDQPKSSAD